jgi:hypothetical protein
MKSLASLIFLVVLICVSGNQLRKTNAQLFKMTDKRCTWDTCEKTCDDRFGKGKYVAYGCIDDKICRCYVYEKN